MLHTVARTLVHEGFVVVPQHIHKIAKTFIEDAMESGERLIRFWSELKCQISLCREGETKPDFGLIDTRDVPGKDLKFYLHVAFDLREMIAKVPDLALALRPYQGDIGRLLMLYHALNKFNLELFSEISQALPDVTGLRGASNSFKETITKSIPGGTTVLRGLLYPKGPRQAGAQPHFDIGFMANHLGDKGGSLLARLTLDSEETENISPAHGEMLIFPGLKALVVSGGKLVPLYHSATADSGQDRQAFVQFNHVFCPSVKSGDGKKYHPVFAQVGILDPNEWYSSFYGR